MTVVTDTFTRLPLDSISVNREHRQRRVIDTTDLEDSIKARGVFNPIIVRNEGEVVWLVAGERRLQACRNLGLPDIPVRFAHDLPPIEYQIIELEENIKRKDISWQERVQATARIHALHLEMDPTWQQMDTANSISTTNSVISTHLKVADSLKDDPRIAECKTLTEAIVLIERGESRARDSGISIFRRGPKVDQTVYKGLTVEQTILNESFLEWAPTYEGEPFNLIHCDFPYGIGVADGPLGRGYEHTFYDDTGETALDLIKCLIAYQGRLLALSGHIMFWYSDKNRDVIVPLLNQIPGVFWLPHPLIWLHAESGITPDYRRRPKHVYDTCLLGTRNRYIVKVVSDVFQCPTDTSLHPSTKPEAMLNYFMSMLVDEHTHVLDPTCGSGSSIRAAEVLEAGRVLGLEINKDYCDAARRKLQESRNFRKASKIA